MNPQLSDLLGAHELIVGRIHRTPVLKSSSINELLGAELYFKCEPFQIGGSFKIRGAMHAALRLSIAQRSKGLITHSSGNFGQALSVAARELNVPAIVIMPKNAPTVKKTAVLSYGATVYECEPTQEAREEKTQEIKKVTGATFLHPYDMENIVLGQSTCAQELLQQVGAIDIMIAPVGGGGLLAGTSLAAKLCAKNLKTYGAEPSGADDASRSLASGERLTNKTVDTIADGLRTNLGVVTFPIIKENVSDILTVDDRQIIEAMKLIWERMKVVVEPSAAVPLAALFKNRNKFAGKRIGVILSGGNVDLDHLPF